MGTVKELAAAIETLIAHPDLPDHRTLPEAFEDNPNVSERVNWIHVSSDNQDEFYDLYSMVQSLADELLITTDGRPDYTNHEELKKLGYSVGPGEQDSFGWLSGIIRTPKGRIVFG